MPVVTKECDHDDAAIDKIDAGREIQTQPLTQVLDQLDHYCGRLRHDWKCRQNIQRLIKRIRYAQGTDQIVYSSKSDPKGDSLHDLLDALDRQNAEDSHTSSVRFWMAFNLRLIRKGNKRAPLTLRYEFKNED